jgi:nitroimidazol reductase NimA-like FMN-containing flavoprotein (pyridoxamine 5'-phosphate oxidase superfamily)
MAGPATELDERFSDEDAVATPWEATRHLLEAAELFWICTTRTNGAPHVTPLVAVWLDETIYFCTGPAEQKAVNLRDNPHVVLMTGCNTWDNGVDVVVEGEAVQVTDTGLLQRLAEAWATKWDGRWRYQADPSGFRDEGGDHAAVVFSVRPRKIFAFAKGTFGQTRYRF